VFDNGVKDRERQKPHAKGFAGILESKDSETEFVDDSGHAFGCVRDRREQATGVELRLINGNSIWFPYSWLGTCQYNPSVGLLIKFTGDLVYLVFIRGSKLDCPLEDGCLALARAGFQTHRLLWVREMTEEEIRHVGETGPSVDSIEVVGFESHDELKAWLEKTAPAFMP
jgi:hypothetical protein